jgi:hypothetical protein
LLVFFYPQPAFPVVGIECRLIMSYKYQGLLPAGRFGGISQDPSS